MDSYSRASVFPFHLLSGGAASACRDWGLDADSWTDFLLGLGLLADGSTAAEKACAPGAFQEKALTHVMPQSFLLLQFVYAR